MRIICEENINQNTLNFWKIFLNDLTYSFVLKGVIWWKGNLEKFEPKKSWEFVGSVGQKDH